MPTTPIKTVYSFVAATTFLDLGTPFGKAVIQQIHPYAVQNMAQTNPAFKVLYEQVQAENSPHVLGSGAAPSPEGYVEAFLAWLGQKGVKIENVAAYVNSRIFVFGGDAQDPNTGKSFNWSVLIYFEM
ncbi:MAG: hypothetical protein AB1564_10480 [Chloroflexota bacterium]